MLSDKVNGRLGKISSLAMLKVVSRSGALRIQPDPGVVAKWFPFWSYPNAVMV